MKSFLLTVILAASPSLWAHPEHKPAAMPKEFDTMKTLVGKWEGTSKMEGKDTPVTVIYELTAGGTAITEKAMPGTDHEMITVYHKDGKKLSLTHYCAMGNQPHMTLKKGDDKSLTFEMTKATGVESMNEPHMHGLTITLADKDTLKQEWVNFQGGKKGETVTMNLKRKN